MVEQLESTIAFASTHSLGHVNCIYVLVMTGHNCSDAWGYFLRRQLLQGWSRRLH